MTPNPSQYCPASPDEFIGKTRVIAEKLFTKIEKLKTNPQSIKLLFTGDPGTGKTALANALAIKMVNHPLGVESTNGGFVTVDVIANWQNGFQYSPMFGSYGVTIINEFDAMGWQAQERILTLLDNLPKCRAFIATSNTDYAGIIGRLIQKKEALEKEHDVLTDDEEKELTHLRRIQSRFQLWQFEALNASEIQSWLVQQWNVPTTDAHGIATTCNGDVRQALNDVQTWMDSTQ